MIKRLDTNGNGTIDPNELNDRMRFMLQRAGVNTQGPISVEKAVAAMEQMRGGGMGGGGMGGGGGRFNRGGPDEADNRSAGAGSDSSRENSKSEDTTPALVPPFGEKTEMTSVPGFGEGLVVATASFGSESSSSSSSSGGSSSSSSSSTSSSSSSSGSSSSSQSDETFRKYAASMMKQNDKNGNGVLEKEEWSQSSTISAHPERFDKNGDGKITMDELIDGLKNWNRDDSGSSAKADTSSAAKSAPAGGPSGDAGGAGRGMGGGGGRRGDFGGGRGGSSTSGGKHYLTPKERLPEGLPDWFASDDTDGDGQVSMHEFASTWTEAKLAEFAKYDLNGDGIITADEALKVAGPKK